MFIRRPNTFLFMAIAFIALASAFAVNAQPYAYVSDLAQNAVTVLNPSTATLVKTISLSGGPSGIAVTPDGSTVYVACQSNNTVAMISTASNTVIGTIGVGAAPIRLGISPNGAYVYVSNSAGSSVSIISTASKSVIATVGVGSKPMGIGFSPDSSTAYVANQSSSTISAISTSSRSVTKTFSSSGPVAIDVLNNGLIYVANQGSNTVTVYDGSANTRATIGGFVGPTSLAATPDGSKLFVANANGGSVSIVNTSSNAITATLPTGSMAMSVAVSADGSIALVANEYQFSVSKVGVSANSILATIPRVGSYPYAVAMQPGAMTSGGGTTCSTTLGSSSVSDSNAATNASVSVTESSSSCSWTASSDSTSWLYITSGSSGTGNGSVGYSVTANTGSGARTGHLTIGEQTFTVTQASAAFSPIRLNCGGPQVTDSSGNVWAADTTAPNYSTTSHAIANANPAALYQTEAWATATLQYQFSVPNGSHTVTLKFAEFYNMQRGQRTFNIVVNGSTWMSNFDVMAYTTANTAYDVNIPVTVTNGQVTIQLVAVTGAAKVDGIEIQ